MSKFYSVVIFLCLFYGLTVGAEVKIREKVFYKQTASTAAVETGHQAESDTKDEVPVVIEGQPPSSESVKLNTVKTIVKKESKTVPRKGVVLDKANEKPDQNGTLIHDPLVEKPSVQKVNTTVAVSNNQSISNSSHVSTSTEKSSTLRVVPVREESEIPDVIAESSTSKTTRKPKPKPIVTVGGKEADEPIPASPTNKSPLGMPRKIDYIVPVVITLTALPLLGAVFYVLYKRGRDYWDKRHYRRMDFLIDGMYNE